MGAMAGCLEPEGDDNGPTDAKPPVALALEPFLTGLKDPVFVTHAGDGSGRLFIVEQHGLVRVWDETLRNEPFLDLYDLVQRGGERGLLGLAFHPDYMDNGRFFVFYTALGGDLTLAEHRNAQPDDDVADTAPGKVILTIEHSEHANHNGGMLAFGPDGYLYVGTGDGGSSGDPDNNAQDLGSLLGKVLRLDVDNVVGTIPYMLPPDNPFGDGESRGEVWAYGLRNPWRFSFDRATGDLWIGDVGQNAYEEVDREPADSPGGVNYGWSLYEGTHVYPPNQGRSAPGAVPPVAEYAHSWGGGDHCSVTGGYVYRGQDIPGLAGTYLFADYCSGFLWTLHGGNGTWTMAKALATGLNVSSFGEDEDGELYVVDHGGHVRRIVAG